MTEPVQDSVAANRRVIALTWRGVQLSLVVVGLSLSSLAIGMYHRPFPSSGALTGMVVLISGYQLRLRKDNLGASRRRTHERGCNRWRTPSTSGARSF
jgi:hypothetical protein